MKETFEKYKRRTIRFQEVVQINDWKVKVYTISYRKKFEAQEVLDNAIKSLPEWLQQANKLKMAHYSIAFLIVHEGKEGVWSLINWWLGGEIKHTMTYFTSYKTLDRFEKKPVEGSLACVFELEVICHESRAWTQHILRQSDSPNFEGYLSNSLFVQ